jgi:hypothetical protein
MFGPTSSEKEAQARAGSIQDVEAYFKQIRNVIKRYKKLVLDLDEIKKDKKKVEKRMELIVSVNFLFSSLERYCYCVSRHNRIL